MAPPASIAQLAERAAYSFDPSIPLRQYLRSADMLYTQSQVYRGEGDRETSFVYLVKLARLIIEDLPSRHPEWQSQSPTVRKKVTKLQHAVLDDLNHLKPIINEDYERWRAAHPTEPAESTEQSANPPISSSSSSSASSSPASGTVTSKGSSLSTQQSRTVQRPAIVNKIAKETLPSSSGRQNYPLPYSPAGPGVPSPGPNQNASATRGSTQDPSTSKDPLIPLPSSTTTAASNARKLKRYSDTGRASPSSSLQRHEHNDSGRISPPESHSRLTKAHLQSQGYTPLSSASIVYRHPNASLNVTYPSLARYAQRPPARKIDHHPRTSKDYTSSGGPYPTLTRPAPTPSPLPSTTTSHDFTPPRPPKLPVSDLKRRPDEYPSVSPPAAISEPTETYQTSCTEGGLPLRSIKISQELVSTFVAIANPNTEREIETCGLLLGKLAHNTFTITNLLIPKQEATADTCTTIKEEEIFNYQDQHDLVTLGWIHTHPTQSCFMSSLDLHTHVSYQMMLAEAIAIVCSPRKTPSVGFFRLTDPPGVKLIANCTQPGTFHPHPDVPIYTDADARPQQAGHVYIVNDISIMVYDLRDK